MTEPERRHLSRYVEQHAEGTWGLVGHSILEALKQFTEFVENPDEFETKRKAEWN